MVVRKRFTQITFLHVFHHSTMLIIWWIVMTWIPVCLSTDDIYSCLFNCCNLGWTSLVWTSFKFDSTCFYVWILWFISHSSITWKTLVEKIYYHVPTCKITFFSTVFFNINFEFFRLNLCSFSHIHSLAFYVVVIIHNGKWKQLDILISIFELIDFRGQLMLNGYMIIMLILFTNFFIHEYVTKSNDAKRRKQRLANENKSETSTETKSPRKNGTRRKAD